ncbi:MAG TPA: hypothetical protein VJZ00_03020 [Thermoanaerobaculia bacterium]|nr:hypothetical protein [Thermoanaerobaculia bacterium]
MRRLSLLIFLSLVPTFLFAGQWGSRGISKRFVTAGNLLYDADGRGVTVYDVSNPANMRAVDVELADDETYDVALTATDAVTATHRGVDRYTLNADGTLTRVAADSWQREGGASHVAATASWIAASGGKQLFALERTKDGLELRAQTTFNDRVLALTAVGRFLYAAVENEGIYVFDPPSLAPVFTLARTAEALALSGKTLWAASRVGGLTAIDVTDAANPRFLSSTALGTLEFDGVAAAGRRVYTFHAPNTVYFFDATDPLAPKLTDTRTEWVSVIGANASNLFLSGPRLDRDKFTYETGTPVRAFNGTQLAGEVHDFAGPVSGVWTDGSVAYVVDPPFFRVLDVSKTDDPKELGSLLLPVDAPQTRVRVKNGIALVYGRDFNHLIDVTDPVRPRFLTTWNPRGHSPDDAAIMADGTFVELNDHSGIHVVDYVNFKPPAQIGGRISHFHGVAAGDDAIYALHEGWLLTMSVTNRAKAEDRSVLLMPGLLVDTAPPNADRPPLLVVAQGSGIRVLDLTANRFAPVETAFLPATPGQFATSNDFALVDLDGTLHRLDLLNPTAFVPTDMHTMSAMQISIAGDKVVVADRYSVRVFGPDTAPPPPLFTPRRRAVGH